jgi:hypothetical protein
MNEIGLLQIFLIGTHNKGLNAHDLVASDKCGDCAVPPNGLACVRFSRRNSTKNVVADVTQPTMITTKLTQP